MLQRFNIRVRLIFLCLVYAVPFTGIILYQITSGINAQIHVAQLEIEGNAYQRVLEELLEKIPLYGMATPGGADADGLKREIDSSFKGLSQVQARLGDDLQVNASGLASQNSTEFKPATLEQKWKALADEAGRAPSDAFAQHVEDLVSGVRGLIVYIGNTSTLILDPDLDSYYMMDLTLCKLPQTQDRLAVIARDGRAALASLPPPAPAPAVPIAPPAPLPGAALFSAHAPAPVPPPPPSIDPALRQGLAVHAALLEQADLQPALDDVKTALAKDPDFYGTSPTLQKNIPPAIKSYQEANEALLGSLREIASGTLVPAADFDAAAARARTESFAAWKVAIGELDVLLQNRIASFANQRLVSILLTLAALAFSSLVAWAVVRSINRQSSRMAGDLVQGVAETLNEAGRLRESSHLLSDAAVKQAAALEETSASLEEMASMSRQNADHIRSGQGLADAARQAAEAGTSRMRELDGSIEGIGALRKQMDASMGEIKESNSAISKIIRTIDEIAFQTNVLSLNAAVEAARAGEAGAGFAVVADEVRNLAQRASKAAQETETLIAKSIEKSDQGVEVSRRVTDLLGSLTELSSKVDSQLQLIAAKVVDVDHLMDQIKEASEQQLQGVSQISTAVSEIDRATQANATQAERTSESADSLNAQSDELRRLVDDLRLLLGAGVGAGTGARTANTATVLGARAPRMELPRATRKALK